MSVATSGEGGIWKAINAQMKRMASDKVCFFVFRGEKELFNFD